MRTGKLIQIDVCVDTIGRDKNANVALSFNSFGAN